MKFLLFLCCWFLFSAFAQKPEIQLANIYREEIEVREYLVSEKLDGIRAYWNGKKLISRQGNEIKAPQWFVANFPQFEIEGELWIGRQKFEEILSITQKEVVQNDGWRNVKFMLFDAPKHKGIFLERLSFLQKVVEEVNSPYLHLIEQKEVANNEDLQKILRNLTQEGGEGLMLRKKNSFYKAQRNDDLMKLKTYQDEEGIVVGYVAGRGDFKGLMGALIVENEDKIRFKIGSGFSIEERKNPPQIGAKITYKFYGKTKNKKPRFVSFLRVRNDF